MKRSVLLTLVLIGALTGCSRREEAATVPESAASPPVDTTEPAPGDAVTDETVPGETVPGEAVPAESAPSEVSPPAAAPATTAEESAAEDAAGANGCNAEPVQNLVGQVYTPELGEQARVTAGAHVERALRPGQIVTMEFRADRLSFTLDEKGRISQVSCG
jgi:hypothetical protein